MAIASNKVNDVVTRAMKVRESHWMCQTGKHDSSKALRDTCVIVMVIIKHCKLLPGFHKGFTILKIWQIWNLYRLIYEGRVMSLHRGSVQVNNIHISPRQPEEEWTFRLQINSTINVLHYASLCSHIMYQAWTLAVRLEFGYLRPPLLIIVGADRLFFFF